MDTKKVITDLKTFEIAVQTNTNKGDKEAALKEACINFVLAACKELEGVRAYHGYFLEYNWLKSFTFETFTENKNEAYLFLSAAYDIIYECLCDDKDNSTRLAYVSTQSIEKYLNNILMMFESIR